MRGMIQIIIDRFRAKEKKAGCISVDSMSIFKKFDAFADSTLSLYFKEELTKKWRRQIALEKVKKEKNATITCRICNLEIEISQMKEHSEICKKRVLAHE